ncbi:MAG: TolC family protein [Myxococcota bacterium]|nr:TolC family protein [Myxococcota bacterium]
MMVPDLRRFVRLLFLVTAVSVASFDAYSQTTVAGDTIRLSFTDAVTRVMEESEEIAAARALVDQAESQVTQATAGALPQLSTNLTYNRAIKTIFDDIGGGGSPGADTSDNPFGDMFEDLPFGRPNNYVATFQLSQLLWAGGTVGEARGVAQNFRAVSRNQLDETRADLTYQVRTAYLNASLAQQLHEIALDSRSVADAHLQQVEAFFQAGTTSEFELLRARVDRENRDPAVVQAENAAELALLELKRLVNIPSDQPIALTTEVEPVEIEIDEERLSSAVLSRPALIAAQEAIEMREGAVRIYRGQRLPSIRLLGNLGFQAFPETAAPPGFNEWREDWSVSLAISWNPFDGFRTKGQIGEAQALLRQAHVEEALLREGLEVELAASLAEYRRASAQIRVTEETVALAERTLELANVRFSNGLSTQLEVSDASLLLDQARVNHVQAVHDYVKAIAHLERVTGGQINLLRFPS